MSGTLQVRVQVQVQVQVRLVRPDEYERAGELVVAAYRALPGGHLSDDYAALLADVARRAREAEVMVAVIAGTEGHDLNSTDAGHLPGQVLGQVARHVAGCVTLVSDATSPWAELLEPGEAGIRMLAVEPRAQHCGAGRALVEACISRSKELGRMGLFLHTTPWMTAAQRLYESLGFERARYRDWTPVPEVPLLAYRLELASRRSADGIGSFDDPEV